MSEHEIYARNLLSEKGFALWLPCPVDIAEVGYVVRGGWIPLFNASKQPGDESNRLGEPNGHHPLDVGELQARVLTSGFPIASERGTSLGIGIKGSSAMCVVQCRYSNCGFHIHPRNQCSYVCHGSIFVHGV